MTREIFEDLVKGDCVQSLEGFYYNIVDTKIENGMFWAGLKLQQGQTSNNYPHSFLTWMFYSSASYFELANNIPIESVLKELQFESDEEVSQR